MQATLHQIKSRRSEDIQVSSAEDFKLSSPRVVGTDVLLRDPTLSLYCLDFRQERAVFVKTPAATDLCSAPFLYQEQRKAAQEVLSVPLGTLMQLAEALPPRFHKIGFLFSMGRCGSSLIMKVVRAMPGVRTLSEPDFLSQLIASPPAQLTGSARSALIKACLPFCVPAAESATHLVVKPRGYTVQLAPALWQAFPQMRAVMLYRDAERSVASSLRMWEERAGAWLPRGATALKIALTVQPKSERELMQRIVPLFEQIPVQRWASIGLSGLLLANWANLLQTYQKLQASGLPMALLRYEDFLDSPLRTLAALLVALEVPSDSLSHALSVVLPRETHASMRLANDENADRLSDKERAGLRELLRIVPLTDVPDRTRAGDH